MVVRRKRESIFFEKYDFDVDVPIEDDYCLVEGTRKWMPTTYDPYPHYRGYVRYSNAVNTMLVVDSIECDHCWWKNCNDSGSFEWDYIPAKYPGDHISLYASPIVAGVGSVHIDEYIVEMGPELYSAECDSYCILFEWIGNRFGDIEEWWVDFGISSESWWIIGDEVKALCDLGAIPFRESKEFFYQLDEWCEGICRRVGDFLSLDAITAHITSVFGMLSYTTSEFVTWLYSSLQEAINFEGLWDWINGADDWVATKLVDFKDDLEDWIADRIESILDKVFKE